MSKLKVATVQCSAPVNPSYSKCLIANILLCSLLPGSCFMAAITITNDHQFVELHQIANRTIRAN